jgi:hypothetical protein
VTSTLCASLNKCLFDFTNNIAIYILYIDFSCKSEYKSTYKMYIAVLNLIVLLRLALQANVDLHLPDGLLPVSSVFRTPVLLNVAASKRNFAV